MHPHAERQAVLDTIRFAGVFIFLVDVTMKTAYVLKSKFAILQIRELYMWFLTWRIWLIVIYNALLVLLMVHKYLYKANEERRKSREFKKEGRLTTEEMEVDNAEDPDAMAKVKKQIKKAELYDNAKESVTQFFCLHIIMRSGFGRLVGLPYNKTRYWYASLGQELFLH